MNIGFYHHGTNADPKVAEKLEKRGVAVCGRNADFFTTSELEKFDKVLVDEGANTAAIKKAYGDKVVSVEDFLAEKAPKAATPAATLNADAERKPAARGQAQGTPKAATPAVVS